MRLMVGLQAVAMALGMAGATQAQSARPLPRVVVIGTGGSISGGTLKAAELVERIPTALVGRVAIETEDFSNIPSSTMTSAMQFKLAQRVAQIFKTRADLAGIVVTHGADSLEETSFLVDLIVDDPRPVVFAAALRSPNVSDPDGPRNLQNAVLTAAWPGARDKGVLVTLNEDIHSARYVQNTHSIGVEAFQSGKKGLVGTVDDGIVIFYQAPLNRVTIPATTIEPKVDLVRLVAGDEGKFIRYAVETKAAGLVVETFGRGNLTDAARVAVEDARKAGMVVVIASRGQGGRVRVSRDMRRAGVISAEDLDGLKARVLLQLALGATADVPTIQDWFHRAGGVPEDLSLTGLPAVPVR